MQLISFQSFDIRRIPDYAGALAALAALIVMQLFPEHALAAARYMPTSSAMLRFEGGEAIAGAQSPNPRRIRPGIVIPAVATAYNAEPDQTRGDPHTTASGARVRPGIIAANFLPMNTVVRANGGIYIVKDRLNARYNNAQRIDIFMEDIARARAFGKRTVLVEIISLP